VGRNTCGGVEPLKKSRTRGWRLPREWGGAEVAGGGKPQADESTNHTAGGRDIIHKIRGAEAEI